MWNAAYIAVAVTLSLTNVAWAQDGSTTTTAATSHGTGQCSCGDLETRLTALEETVRQLVEGNPEADIIDTPETSVSDGNACQPLEVRRCEAMQTGRDYTVLDASGPGSWPSSSLCRVVSTEDTLNLEQYSYSVELYNQVGWSGVNSGHPGIAFNVIDANNFDFVYFRPHWVGRSNCVQHGYLSSGSLHFTTVAYCSSSSAVGARWFKVKVECGDDRATVYLDDARVSAVGAHFPTRSQTGIIVANGYSNIIRFRDIEVYATEVGRVTS